MLIVYYVSNNSDDQFLATLFSEHIVANIRMR